MKFSFLHFSIGLLVIGLLLIRLIQFGAIPLSLYWDELAMGFDAYAIAKTGMDIHGNHWFQAIFPSYGDFKAPLAIWLVSLSTYLFGLAPWSLRLPFLIMGYLGVLGMWLLIKEVWKKDVIGLFKKSPPHPMGIQDDVAGGGNHFRLLTILFFITSPWHFHFSRIGFESGLSLNVLIWGLLCLIKGLKGRGGWLLIAGLLSGFTVYVYVSARYIVPLFWVVALGAYWKQAWKKRRWLIPGILLVGLVQIPLYTSPFYAPSQQYRWAVDNFITDGKVVAESARLIYESGNSITSRIIYHRYWFLGQAFLKNYLAHFTPSFWFLDGDPNLRHHTGWGGELLLVTAPMLLLGFYWLFNHLKTSVSWLTLGWLLAAPFTAAVPYEVPHASRAIYMLIPMTLLFGMGVRQAITGVSQKTLKAAARLFPFIRGIKHQTVPYLVLLALLLNFGVFLEDYLHHYPTRSAYFWQLANTDIGKAVASASKDYNKIVATNVWYLPFNAVLFYNPQYILELQKEAKKSRLKMNTWWTQGSFEPFRFEDAPGVEGLEENVLYLIRPDEQYRPYVQAEYVYPDGKPALFVVEKVPRGE